MKKFLKVLGLIFAVLIAIYIILDVTFSVQLHNKIAELKRQGRPTTIAEIIPPPVPDEENAAILYNKAFELMKSYKEGSTLHKIGELTRDIPNWNNEQREEISKLINSQEVQDIYELLEKGSQKPKCRFNIEYEKGPETLLPHLNHMRYITRLFCARALLEAESGDVEKAVNTLLIGLRISNHLKDEPIEISQLLRIFCDGMIIECIKNIADSKSISLEQANVIISELSTRKDIKPFIKGEDNQRILGIWFFQDMLHNKIPLSVLLAFDNWYFPRKVKIISSLILPLYKPILKKDFLFYLTLEPQLQDSFNLPYCEFIKNNPIEKGIPRYYRISLYFFRGEQLPDPYNMILKGIARHQANIEICKTGLALKIYKAKNGAYPETLSFLSEVPIDPFSGKELIYKKSGDGFILYSLGPDMKDDKGTPKTITKGNYNPANDKDYDIVWKCEDY